MSRGEPLEYPARRIAEKLKGSGVPYHFLVSAARRALTDGDTLRDSAVIVEARTLERIYARSYGRNANQAEEPSR